MRYFQRTDTIALIRETDKLLLGYLPKTISGIPNCFTNTQLKMQIPNMPPTLKHILQEGNMNVIFLKFPVVVRQEEEVTTQARCW